MQGDNDLHGSGGKKIVIIGGTGAVGSTIAQLAQKLDLVDQIICADKNLGNADQFTAWADWSKIQLCQLDFERPNEKQIQMLLGASVIINAATFVNQANIKIMNLALRLGSNYVDLASENNAFPPEESSFHNHFRKHKLIGLFNWGIGPGLTNLMTRQLIDGLENCQIQIFLCEQTETTEKRLALYNLESALNEATSPVPRYFGKGNNHLGLRRALSEGEDYIFPGLAKIKYYLANENEGVTISTLSNVDRIQTKVGGTDIERLLEHITALNKLLRLLPRNAPPSRIEKVIKQYKERSFDPVPSPEKMLAMIKSGSIKESTISIAVEVNAFDPKVDETVCKRVTWQSPKLAEVQKKFPGKTPMQYVTAFMALQAVQRMFRSRSILPGVWPPEALKDEDREIVFTRLKEAGMPVCF